MNTDRLDSRKKILFKTLDSLTKFNKSGNDLTPIITEFIYKLHAHTDVLELELSKLSFNVSDRDKRMDLKSKRSNSEEIMSIFTDVFGKEVTRVLQEQKK